MFARTKNPFNLLAVLAVLTLLVAPRGARAADYVIQPEDVISIKVDGEAGLSKDYVVDEKGDITMDLVDKVRVAGLTAKEAQEKVTKALEKYLKLFEVKLKVLNEIGNRVLVYGEVTRPGSTKIRMGDKLLDVLAVAGPPTLNADTKRITVTKKGNQKSETVDLDALITDAKLNLEIEAGDTITVPSKAKTSVRVDGEVSKPGSLPIETYETVYSAVKGAGPTEKTDWTRIALRKKGTDTPLMIDLSKVRSGQAKDDIKLDAGDQLTVMSKFNGTAKINGEVKNPGEKDLLGPIQLREFVLTLAGGFTEEADQMRVQVLREGKPVEFRDILAVSKGLKRSDDPEFAVQPGDVIYVSRATARIRGEVKTPQEYALGGISNLWDFITGKGGGFTENADRSKVTIHRKGQPDRVVNLELVAEGKKSYDDPELELLPGDQIDVPSNEGAKFTIVGAVKKAGKFVCRPNMRLLDALAMAEGFDVKSEKTFVVAPAAKFDKDGNLIKAPADSGKQGKKARSKKSDEDELAAYGLIVIDKKKLLSGDPSQNVAINPGDKILIPERPEAKPGRPGGGGGGILGGIMGLMRMMIFPYGGFGGGYGY